MEQSLEIINFHEDKLYCPVIDGEPYVIVSLIIQTLCLNYKSAINNLKYHPRLGKRLIELKIQNDKIQSTVRWISFKKNGQNEGFLAEKDSEWEYLREEIKGYKYTLLPVRKISGWLYGISLNKVNPEIREKLEQYQEECDDVLFDHFFGDAPKRRKTLTEKALAEMKAESIAKKLRAENEDFKEYEGLKALSMRKAKELKHMDALQLQFKFIEN